MCLALDMAEYRNSANFITSPPLSLALSLSLFLLFLVLNSFPNRHCWCGETWHFQTHVIFAARICFRKQGFFPPPNSNWHLRIECLPSWLKLHSPFGQEKACVKYARCQTWIACLCFRLEREVSLTQRVLNVKEYWIPKDKLGPRSWNGCWSGKTLHMSPTNICQWQIFIWCL